MSSHRVSDTGLDGRAIRRIAVAADVDPRSVAQYLRGASVRPSTRDRVRKALERDDLAQLAPPIEAAR